MLSLRKENAFTLLELLIVMAIIAILSTVTFLTINPRELTEKSRTSSAKESLQHIANAANIYAANYGMYPPDEVRNIPQAFIEFLAPGAWPGGPFPDSVYDWDNWSNSTCWDGSTGIIQITLRDINDYEDKEDYTFYYVLQGQGIPHCMNSDVKGICVNCVSRYE